MVSNSSAAGTTMSPTRRFMQLDVFSSRPLLGNPLAVVIDADGLDTPTMQAIARWTNLSETTFLLPPSNAAADYRVRIFTPRQELPFAGHPSVGSAYVAIEAGLVPAAKTSLIQECAAGLLPVRVEGQGTGRTIHVQAPPAELHRLDKPALRTLAGALGIKPDDERMCLIDNGPHWIIVQLADAQAVRKLAPDLPAIAQLCRQLPAVGVSVFGQSDEPAVAMAVRAFCPADGIDEDPVTGSANAAIAAYLLDGAELDRFGQSYRVSQGREVGRDGYVEVTINTCDSTITVGGRCALSLIGQLAL
jgi:PhzF family phenazine biosynthesis protein